MDTGNDEEGEELVPRHRAFFGMKFHDEVSEQTARRVAVASAVLGVLVVLHAIYHIAKYGHFAHTVPHVLLGLVLPFVGYRAATLRAASPWRARLLWSFHLGNVVFVLVHVVLLCIVVTQILELEAAPAELFCDGRRSNDPGLRPAAYHGPQVMPTLPPFTDSHEECLRHVEAEKVHAPGLMTVWLLISLPYWLCSVYAAYYSHELYLQLVISQLTIKRGTAHGEDPSREDGLATVGWQETVAE